MTAHGKNEMAGEHGTEITEMPARFVIKCGVLIQGGIRLRTLRKHYEQGSRIMAKVIVTIRGKRLREVLIPRDGALTIGRDRSNMVVLDNLAVSRNHASIVKQGWPYYVEDHNSTNGCRINGKPIDRKASLKHNDKVGIGKFELIFRDEDGIETADGVVPGENTIAVDNSSPKHNR